MGSLKDVVGALLFDSTPEEKASVFRLVFRVFGAGFVAYSFGILAPFGMSGFVRADSVDDKVQAAVEPLRSQIGQVSVQLEAQDRVLKQIRIDQLSTKLRELHIIQCSAKDPYSQERLAAEIETAQRQYRELVGERYPFDACKP